MNHNNLLFKGYRFLLASLFWLGLFFGPVVADPPDSFWKPLPELSDEFDGDQLDPIKWHPNNPTWLGRKPGYFMTNNVAVNGGQLHLTIKYEDPPPEAPAAYSNYTCAAVKSTERVLYGYYEVRAKAMDSVATSDFWFYDTTPENWTEIDVFENPARAEGYERTVRMATHVFWTPEIGTNHLFAIDTKVVDTPLSSDYRIFGLEWTPTWLKFYVDNEQVWAQTNTHWHQPLYINMDTETQPEWYGFPAETNLPSTYSIDYFRAWEEIATPIKITEPEDGTAVSAGFPIDVAAGISDTVTASQVEFYLDSSALIGVDTDGADGWGIVWSNATLGLHELSAILIDAGGMSSTSRTASISIHSPRIPVENPSFEADILPDSAKAQPATSWTSFDNATSGALNLGLSDAVPEFEATVDGINVGFANSDSSALFQSLGTHFVEGSTYTLTASVGRYGPHWGAKGWWQLELQRWSGTAWQTVANINAILEPNIVYDEDEKMVCHSLVHTADVADDGKEIRIALKSSWGARMLFDDISLEVVPLLVGYYSFMDSFGITQWDARSAPDEDYDSDGQPNVAEYGLGGNPTNAFDRGIDPTFAYGADDMVNFNNVVLTDLDVDITYVVEQTTNLVDSPWTNSGWNGVATNSTADPAFDEVQHRISGEDKDQLFIRLRISHP